MKKFMQKLKKVANQIKSFFEKKKDQVEDIIDTVDNAVDAAATVVTNLENKVEETVGTALDIVGEITDTVETVVDVVEDVQDTVKSTYNEYTEFKNDAKDFVEMYLSLFVYALVSRFKDTDKAIDLNDPNLSFKINPCFKYVVKDTRRCYKEFGYDVDEMQLNIFTGRLLLNKSFERDFKKDLYIYIDQNK